MPVYEQKRLNSGFTTKDLQKLRCHTEASGDPLEQVINELASHFRALIWILTAMLVITVIVLLVGSPTHIISWLVAAVFLSVLFIIVMPVRLGFKSWQFRRLQSGTRKHL
ncbi:hypothetical protein [Entomohabitans teleogrylli]|uniref:hypothetical protein n=1 Tax=Entomohabitans teleogrylli TaxID=1384589 RepID=UPI00073D861F|nr:hypothetical protein [Entomohabitans teleogrylli]